MPDATLFYDITPEEAFGRKGGADDDRMEQSGLAFHRKVYEGYKALAEKFPERIIVIDAKKSAEEVLESSLAALKAKGIL